MLAVLLGDLTRSDRAMDHEHRATLMIVAPECKHTRVSSAHTRSAGDNGPPWAVDLELRRRAVRGNRSIRQETQDLKRGVLRLETRG